MLRIKRCARESLMIDDDIEIIVLDVKNGVAEIGINAPKHRRVLRKEIYNNQPRLDNGQASGSGK